MSVKQKVQIYLNEMPKRCLECPCCALISKARAELVEDGDYLFCNPLRQGFNWKSTRAKLKDCPLKSIADTEAEIDNLELQLREQYENVDDLDDTVETLLEHIKWLRGIHLGNEQSTIKYAINKLEKLETKLNDYGEPIDIGVLGIIAKEIKDLEMLLDE